MTDRDPGPSMSVDDGDGFNYLDWLRDQEKKRRREKLWRVADGVAIVVLVGMTAAALVAVAAMAAAVTR